MGCFLSRKESKLLVMRLDLGEQAFHYIFNRGITHGDIFLYYCIGRSLPYIRSLGQLAQIKASICCDGDRREHHELPEQHAHVCQMLRILKSFKQNSH